MDKKAIQKEAIEKEIEQLNERIESVVGKMKCEAENLLSFINDKENEEFLTAVGFWGRSQMIGLYEHQIQEYAKRRYELKNILKTL